MQRPKQGETYWCDPDPKLLDQVGSEQKGDRIWLIVSYHQRGKCVVALPLSRHIEKSESDIPWLIKVTAENITMVDGNPAINRLALTDQIRCLDKVRLRKQAGFITQRAVIAVLDGLDKLLGRRFPLPNSN